MTALSGRFDSRRGKILAVVFRAAPCLGDLVSGHHWSSFADIFRTIAQNRTAAVVLSEKK